MAKTFLKALSIALIALIALLSLASCDMLPDEIKDLIGIGGTESGECKHMSVEWVTDMEASCKFEGTKHSVCLECNEIVEYGTIPLADHELGEWEIDYDSTCAKEGLKYKKCSTCKRKILEEALPLASAHSYDFGSCIHCSSEQPASTGLAFKIIAEGEAEVSGIGTCKDTSLVIPELTPTGERVVAIGSGAFLYQSGISSVVIPESVSSAGTNAFTGTYISRASVPAAIASALKCDSLVELVIVGTGAIPEGAMTSAPNLTSLVIKEGITEIGKSAFEACANLKAIAMPDSLVTIGERAFARCSTLTRVVIGSGVVTIGDYAFNNSHLIASVNIPASVKYIGIGAFLSRAAADRVNKSQLTSAVFELSEGWYAMNNATDTNGAIIDPDLLADKEQAAIAINATYAENYLKRP